MSNQVGGRTPTTIQHVGNDNVEGVQQLDALILAGVVKNKFLQRIVHHQVRILHQDSLGASRVLRVAEHVKGGGPLCTQLIRHLLPISKDTLKLGVGDSLENVRRITWQRGHESLELLQLLQISQR